METNQNPAQEYPAQPISEFSQPIPHSVKPLYNPDEAARIMQLLADLYDPEYILLFGALAGGMPHSDAVAYDLLVVTRDVPRLTWQEAKRLVRLKFPPKYREIPYVNIYVASMKFVASGKAPFLWFARKEGVVLYQRENGDFRRPRTPLDLPVVGKRAAKHLEAFLPLGRDFIREAETALAARKLRFAAIMAGQAAQVFYRTLHFVFHGVETTDRDLLVLHDRLRTLSAQLMLLFDDDHVVSKHSLPDLRNCACEARYDLDFEIDARDLTACLDAVRRLSGIVEQVCRRRIERYLAPLCR